MDAKRLQELMNDEQAGLDTALREVRVLLDLGPLTTEKESIALIDAALAQGPTG